MDRSETSAMRLDNPTKSIECRPAALSLVAQPHDNTSESEIGIHGDVIPDASENPRSVSGPLSGVAMGIGRSAICRNPSIARRNATDLLLSGSRTNSTSDRPVISKLSPV